MLELNIIIYISLLSLGLIITGYIFQNKNKNSLFLGMAGSLVILILGIMLFNNPIQYQQGTNTTYNDTEVITQITYSNLDETSNNLLAWIFTLIGLSTIIANTTILYTSRFDDY